MTHLSRAVLARLFSARGTQPEIETAIPHILRCESCWKIAFKAIDDLRRDSTLVEHPSDQRATVLTLLEQEEQQTVDQLRARGWWAELRSLPHRQQLERIRSVSSLQTQVLFDVAIGEASSLGSSDPHMGQETALAAQLIAELLPNNRYSREIKADLKGEALIVAANCRRLTADWSGAQAALREASNSFKQGTGDPSREARLLSVSASLASDTGNLEAARNLIARAAALYRANQDGRGMANAAVQEAGTLLACFRFEDAIRRASSLGRIDSARCSA